MQFIRKKLLLIVCILIIYTSYFVTRNYFPTTQHVLGVSSHLSLFTQPESGKQPLLDAINTSQKEVDVEVYLLSDSDVIASLISACQRGIVVRVMLEEHPFGGGTINQKTFQSLSPTCVKITWTNSHFSLTHEKTILIDGREVFILNQNLTTASFSKNREYDIIDTNQDDSTEIQRVFDADWTRNSFQPTNENLVISPVNSRAILSSFLQSATKSLAIETEVISDSDIVHLLMQKVGEIPIQIILPSFSQIRANRKTATRLSAAGVAVRTLSSPYIHAKLILQDSAKAYVGSINLTTQSMDENREVGIIISQQDIVSQLMDNFARDWGKATPFTN